MLQLVDSNVETCYHLIFAIKLRFFSDKILDYLILSLDIKCKPGNFILIFCFYSLNDIFFVFLMTFSQFINGVNYFFEIAAK